MPWQPSHIDPDTAQTGAHGAELWAVCTLLNDFMHSLAREQSVWPTAHSVRTKAERTKFISQ